MGSNERQARARGGPEGPSRSAERTRKLARARRLYLAGDGSQASIADRVGLPRSTVYKAAQAEQWNALRQAARNRGIAAAADAAADAVADRYTRLVTIADRAMDAAADGLEQGTYARTAHDLNEAARALLSLRDLVGAMPPGDRAEQDARIDKLRAESKRISEADAPQVVRIEISPEADGWSD